MIHRFAHKVVDFFQNIEPETRVLAAVYLLLFTLLAWPSTHVMMLVTQPQGFTSWAAHVLLGISWLAISFTAIDIIVTTDVRSEVEE